MKPHIHKRLCVRYRPWCCVWEKYAGTGWNPEQAYFQLYWNVQFGQLGSGNLPAPILPPR